VDGFIGRLLVRGGQRASRCLLPLLVLPVCWASGSRLTWHLGAKCAPLLRSATSWGNRRGIPAFDWHGGIPL